MAALVTLVGASWSTFGPGAGASVDDLEHYAEDAYTPIYSPWLVSIHGENRFETISFKDVGLHESREDVRDMVLHAIADSLALDVTDSLELVGPGVVSYEKSLKDPNEHLFCASKHVYVDLWRGENPERWGYSLWSGCNETDQFAWAEVEAPYSVDEDAVDAVAPLTSSIAESLQDATHRDCFQRECSCMKQAC